MSREKEEKKKVDQSLGSVKKLMSEGKLDECGRHLNALLPVVGRLKYREYETFVMHSIVWFKANDFEKAMQFSQSALSLKPDDAQMYKIQLNVLVQKKDASLAEKAMEALKNCKPVEFLCSVISTFVGELENNDLTHLYVKALQQLPNDVSQKYVMSIPDEDDFKSYRVELLKLRKDDPDACSDLVYSLIDLAQYDECLKYAKCLPEDHADRIYAETLFGDDPIESAKKHIKLGKTTFRDWYDAVIKAEYDKVRNQLAYLPSFLSGYIHFFSFDLQPSEKSSWADQVVSKFPQNLRALKAALNAKSLAGDFKSELIIANTIMKISPAEGKRFVINALVNNGSMDEAEIMADDDEMSIRQKALINISMWKKDEKDERLWKVLSFDNCIDCAEAKAEAVNLLGKKIDPAKANAIFVEQLKLDKNNCMLYAFYGKYLKNVAGDSNKGDFLLKKALDLGYKGEEAFELYSKQLIEEGKTEEALELCLKIDSNWSHLRAGLLLFKKKEFESASIQLQAHLKKEPNCIEAWIILGYTYFALSRLMSAISVSQKLQELGHPNYEMQQKIDSVLGSPITPQQSDQSMFKLDETPLLFTPYLAQSIERLRRFLVFGRQLTCQFIVQSLDTQVSTFVEKWGKLSAVLKQSGDFYIEAFTTTGNLDYLQKAQVVFMKRAEIDRRGECFIDVAQVLHLRGLNEQAVLILRRAVKTFPDNQSVWINLGIAFSIVKKFSYARHCLCVAAKISDDTEKASIFSYCAAIAMLIDDEGLLARAIDAAKLSDPNNASIWELQAAAHSIDQFSGEILAYQNSPSTSSISTLVDLCILQQKPLEALGFAFMSKERKNIEKALEANQQYEYALLFADDITTKQRLQFLSKSKITNQDSPTDMLLEAINFFSKGDFDSAAASFIKMDNAFSRLGAAACILKKGRNSQAAKVVQKQIENLPKELHESLDSLAINTFKEIEPKCPNSTHSAINLLLHKFNKDVASYKNFIQNPDQIESIHFFIVENLQNEDDTRNELLFSTSKVYLARTGTREALFLYSLVLLRMQNFPEAKERLQQYCILNPSASAKLIPYIRTL